LDISKLLNSLIFCICSAITAIDSAHRQQGQFLTSASSAEMVALFSAGMAMVARGSCKDRTLAAR
jgi:hypothetical protein